MLGFAVVSLTAGFCEEVLFRGFLFGWLQHLGMGVAPAAIGTVLAFGFAHSYQGWKGTFKTAVAGTILVGLTLLAESLWPAILLHIGSDLLAGWTSMEARPKSTSGTLSAVSPTP